MKIAVILDPLESIKTYKDSTYAMMVEAARRGHQIAVLIVGAMMEVDDTGIGPRAAIALADHLRLHANGVAVKYRLAELNVRHAEVGDRGAERRVGDGDADHQP